MNHQTTHCEAKPINMFHEIWEDCFGYKFPKPSHMTKEETWDLLDHWYNQKNNINAKVIFRFKSTLHPVANKGKGKRKGKAAMKRVLPRVRMVAPRSNSTDEEQEEIKGPDKILSDDERGADVQNQPGPSEPAARQQTVAFQESTTRMGLGISLEGPGLAPSISGHQSSTNCQKTSPGPAPRVIASQRITWTTGHYKCLIGILQRLLNNHKFGDLESMFSHTFNKAGMLKRWVACADCPPAIKEYLGDSSLYTCLFWFLHLKQLTLIGSCISMINGSPNKWAVQGKQAGDHRAMYFMAG
ncbi:hypothetical protein SERLA73DRAFT_149170 [Serpula lacrymans var. lacrymans S7.3]|uniref:Uncharacterized protein n=1 Tax=Serpula lacrymans var. lacrymans (strain S7.3) TaxID=936435 RepID=F8PG98_SERL3|nr:hypothetical protein SERLA73DRAFT_149170 [Serpula lacrymans var. lacrymans S7.3]